MTARSRAMLFLLAGLLLALAAPAPSASAAPARPAWKLGLVPVPAALAPGKPGELQLRVTNVGGAPTDGSRVDVQLSLPPELEVLEAVGAEAENSEPEPLECSISGQIVSCETGQVIVPSDLFLIRVELAVPAALPAQALELGASASGGGALSASVGSQLIVSPDPLFGFLGPLTAPLTNPDGTPATQAGGHPGQYTVDFNFPTVRSKSGGADTNDRIKVADPPRTIITSLPPGLIADPAATPVLCTEAQLLSGDTSTGGCPPASHVGMIAVTTSIGGAQAVGPIPTSLYNMVPPPGAPAELAFDAARTGIYVHLIAGVRTDGDYAAYTELEDAPALRLHPVIGAQAQVWGDPSSPAYDQSRSNRFLQPGAPSFCHTLFAPCPVADQKTAFLTNPGHCSGAPDVTSVAASTWGAPDIFTETSYESADLEGNPVAMSGCSALRFEPTIAVAPTTNLVDSPSGLDVDLHQPQDFDKEHRATAQLRDARVTLPAGMSVNPSQADGLGACSLAQIGFEEETAAGRLDFSKSPNSCPDAAKLGTVEVATPLLVQRNAAHETVTDPETGLPIPEPLHGSVYLAEPFDNPFGSLLAIYLAVEDPKTGIVAKLAGRVEPDPRTGQLTTVFSENPQLPLEDIRLHLFGGARGSLITPPSCATNTTTTDLVPWSAPETPDAAPTSSFQTTAMPGGGPCALSPAAAPNSPSFTAGTLNPQAGAYTPFVLKLSREDGSQRLTGFDTVLPPGLTGKLAGVGECSEAGIARAASRSNPEEGILERDDPSCPAASRLGTVTVGAGAGPLPFYARGSAYLAGPYKGAPLSMAVITPAIAGPFDLGVVVVRAALYVDPFTAQIHAVSDPFPAILHGIPLDLRSVAVGLDRPGFTLNPTSCNPMAITGHATSAFGQLAPLSERFQAGGCSGLGFKPKLTLKLKGGTKRSDFPSLIAKLTYPSKGAYANIASAQVNLPHSEFLEQGHIRTVCTRPQLASHTCPVKSIYGYAKAVTPLLDKPLEGPVYLGVGFGHQLPDLVADLNGQIEVLLHGKTDTGKNDGLRNTFQVVPDAPVSSFTLTLFGSKRGLIVNSENLCGPHAKRQAFAHFTAQNGKVLDLKPVVQNQCGEGRKGKKKRQGAHHHR